MSHGKHFTFFSERGGPNGWKVIPILEELGIIYETKYLDFAKKEQKGPQYTKYNPNGRIPTLIDHKNNDFVIWESNAIILYLVDKYDTEKKLTVTDPSEKHTLVQWLFFQASGQGPYFGQAGWFMHCHPEKVPSAVERYQKEILRVFGVLDSVLSKQEWLVGGKPTVADLSFVMWNELVMQSIIKDYPGFNFEKDFPAMAIWHAKLVAREKVKEALAVREHLVTEMLKAAAPGSLRYEA